MDVSFQKQINKLTGDLEKVRELYFNEREDYLKFKLEVLHNVETLKNEISELKKTLDYNCAVLKTGTEMCAQTIDIIAERFNNLNFWKR